MPIDPDTLRITAPVETEPRLVRLTGGPLGAREHFVPPGAEPGFKIVVHRDGRGQKMRPVVYELQEGRHPKFGELAVYAGFATDDDVRRWLNREGEAPTKVAKETTL